MRIAGAGLLAFSLIFLSASLGAEDDTARVSPKQPSSTSAVVNHPKHLEAPIVLLVSFDGFRADYLDRYDLPSFQRFMREGVRAEGLIPVFPSVTHPNHYSIMTGLYPEHHGIVGNVFYDPDREEVFNFSESTNGSWYRGDPIWRVAESQGMVTACHSWPGCPATIKKIRSTFWKSYNGDLSNDGRVDQVLSWLQLPDTQRPHVLMLYMGDLDDAGHQFGPDSPEVQRAAEKVDRELGRLLNGLDTLPNQHQIYVILVSDHGMRHVDRANFVWMDDLGLDLSEWEWKGMLGSYASLHATAGKHDPVSMRDQINDKLKHGRAFLREDVPAALHYRQDPRIGDVVIIMEQPHLIAWKMDDPSIRGDHGWNPSDPTMHGVFLARGRGLKRGARIPAFQNVDIYPLLAELLNVSIAENIDGQAGRLKQLIME
ncbi:MAG: ectonucleotide pyrophosphatase/phosphodiesterase [Nitrospira sp.]